MAGKLAAFVIFSALFCGSLAKDIVPVLIWNPNEAQSGLPAVSALQYIDYPTFQAKYLESFNPTNILLFIQDALSVEDLSSHSTELHHVNQWMESGHSLYLPNVEDPAHMAHDLPSHGYNVVLLEPGTSTAGLQLKKGDKNLVIVKLPSTLTHPKRSLALQKADEVMENVISKIGDKEDFTVVFTGRAPSVKMQGGEGFEQRVRIARSLQAAPLTAPYYHSYACVMLFLYKNITIQYSGDAHNNMTIDESEWVSDIGDCQDHVAKLVMRYKKSDTNEQYKVTVIFKNVNSEWMLEAVEILGASLDDSFVLEEHEIEGIPIGMSYSCSEKRILRSNETNGIMIFHGFQVQAFTASNTTRFGPSWDCVGFFTVPIWCALLVTLLLLVILFSGMYMLGDIKTMDRFDDPKGKPIMVATTAD